MKFAILSLVAVAGLTLSADSALAGPPGHYHGGYGGYNNFHPVTPHLDYHRGHYHYHDGFYRSGPLVPVYPSYGYGRSIYGPSIYGPSIYGYNSGFGRPGYGFATPYYGGGYGRRW